MKEIKFKTLKEAKKHALKFKKTYGYKPAIFSFPDENKHIIIKPKCLKKLKLEGFR